MKAIKTYIFYVHTNELLSQTVKALKRLPDVEKWLVNDMRMQKVLIDNEWRNKNKGQPMNPLYQ